MNELDYENISSFTTLEQHFYILHMLQALTTVYEALIEKKGLSGDIAQSFLFIFKQMEFITAFEREAAFDSFGKYIAIKDLYSFHSFFLVLNEWNVDSLSFFEFKIPADFNFIVDIPKLIISDIHSKLYLTKTGVIDVNYEISQIFNFNDTYVNPLITENDYIKYLKKYLRSWFGTDGYINLDDNSLMLPGPELFNFDEKTLLYISRALGFNLKSANYSYDLLNFLIKGVFFNDSLFLNDMLVFLPFFYFFIFLLFILIFSIYINKYIKNVNIISIISVFSIIFLFLSFFLFLNLLSIFNLSNIFLFNYMFNIDYLSLNSIIFIFFILILFISFFIDYFINEKIYTFEYLIIVLIAVFGLICLICSFDFLSLYISIELQTLCLYILASYKYFSNFSTEAGLKYFVLGALSSGFLLFGISVLYGLVGSTNFYDIFLFLKGMNTTNYLNLEFFFILNKNIGNLDFEILNTFVYFKISIFFSFLFIMFSFFFKLGIAPFHIWLPDVYQGSPSISTAFFSLLPKIGFFAIFLKFIWYCVSIFYINNIYMDLDSFGVLKELYLFREKISFVDKLDPEFANYFWSFHQTVYSVYKHIIASDFSHIFSIINNNYNLSILNYNYIFLFCSVLSLIIGTFSALNQSKIKRFIAFSAIVHVGFIFINLISFNLLSYNVIILYIFLYTLINLNFFSIFLSIRDSFNNKKLYDIMDFSNIYKTNKLLVYFFILNMFSMAGVPPLSGFFMKMYVFYNLINSSFLIIFFLIIISCFGAYYYIRLINISLFKINKNVKSLKRLSKFSSYIIVLSSYFNLFFFLFPNFFFEYFFEIVNSFEKVNLIFNPMVIFF